MLIAAEMAVRERYCKTCKGWHQLDAWPYNCMPKRNASQSDLPAPMLIRDGMDAVQSQLDGKMYDSKRELRRTYREAGVVEVGNDSSVVAPKAFQPPRPDKKQISDAVDKALTQTGFGPV